MPRSCAAWCGWGAGGVSSGCGIITFWGGASGVAESEAQDFAIGRGAQGSGWAGKACEVDGSSGDPKGGGGGFGGVVGCHSGDASPGFSDPESSKTSSKPAGTYDVLTSAAARLAARPASGKVGMRTCSRPPWGPAT